MQVLNTLLSAVVVAGLSTIPAFASADEPQKKCQQCSPFWQDEWETFFNRMTSRSAYGASTMKETDKAYLISIDLPGMEKKDIKVETAGNRLNVSGERKEENEGKEGSKRAYSQFQQSYLLPDDANLEAISAASTNGVLKITVPKSGKKASKKIEVK